jgi:hypothetical protein
MASGLETLLRDAENLVESDLPSVSDVRKVLGALVKRLEQGFLDATKPTSTPTQPVPSLGSTSGVPVVAPQPATADVLAAIVALGQSVQGLATDVAALKAPTPAADVISDAPPVVPTPVVAEPVPAPEPIVTPPAVPVPVAPAPAPPDAPADVPTIPAPGATS